MRWCTLFLVGLTITAHDSVAQTVSGLVSSATIGTEETVAYTLEISGASDSDIISPRPPDAEGLLLVSTNASRSSSVSITNGRISRSVSYTWHYRPQQEGDARILEASVMIDDEIYTAPPVSITVVPQAQRPRPQRRSPFGGFSIFDDPTPAPPPAVQDIFIRAVQSSREAYENEQITLDYRLYFRPGTSPRNLRQADSWDAEGFWREELELSETPVPELVVENGIRYQVISIQRVAVFPARTGELSIDPLKISAEVQSPDADPFSIPFFSSAYSTVERTSPTINIISKALPRDAPNGFTGAVGQYSLNAELNQTELEVGEALQLTVTVKGTGNIALIETPKPDFPGIFEVYDPEVNISKTANGNLIGGQKTSTWLLIPKFNGTFQIPPIRFVFFDPSQSEYVVRSATLDPIRITGTGTSPIVATSTASGFPVDDIVILKRDSRWTTVSQSPLHHQTWFYLILVIPLLGLGGTAMLNQRMSRLATDTAWARNRKAHPLARKHLKQAKKLLTEGNPDKFYAALEQSVLGFLGNRMNISERGLTRAQLTSLLAETGILVKRQKELVEFLNVCDAARFAPTPPEKFQMKEHLVQAGYMLSALAQEIESSTQ